MTIKETAGKALLYFYQLQRTVPASMSGRQLGFFDKENGGVSLTSDKKWLTKDLLDINSSSTDIFNAYTFLLDKGFIRSQERTAKAKKIYVGIYVTDTGIDIVEGIERGHDGHEEFTKMFNISVGSGANVESLIKDNLHTLLSEQ